MDPNPPRRAAIRAAVRPDGRAVAIGELSGARTLHATILHHDLSGDDERLVVRAGRGEVMIVLTGQGRARVDALDRDAGAGFVDDVAVWLGTPLGPPALAGAPRSLRGTWARGGAHRDAAGTDWQTYSLVIAGVLLVLRVSGTRALLVEADRTQRAPLVTALDHAVGLGRRPSQRAEVGLAGGRVRVSIPATWMAACPDHTFDDASGRYRAGGAHDRARVVDPCDRACLDLLTLPGGGAVHAGGMLRDGLAGRGVPAPCIVTVDRGDLELAWHEDSYAAAVDGRALPARSRLLLASNAAVHVIATFSYWLADADWAVAEWERIVSTLELVSREPRHAVTS